jgi:hypothetical protein
LKDDTYRPPENYNEGPRKLNILHTRLRHKCSSLNADLSRIHVIDNYKCNCGGSFEDDIHYLLECPLYPNERRTLLSDCDDVNIIIAKDELEDTKVVIRIRKSKKNKQHNGQKKKYKRTNNDLQDIHITLNEQQIISS